jgi:hypothetical protein
MLVLPNEILKYMINMQTIRILKLDRLELSQSTEQNFHLML